MALYNLLALDFDACQANKLSRAKKNLSPMVMLTVREIKEMRYRPDKAVQHDSFNANSSVAENEERYGFPGSAA